MKEILIIDDDEICNFINKKIIESLEISVSLKIFTTSEKAFSYLESSKISNLVIVLDIQMPVLDGFDFLEKINESDKVDLKNVDIILCSASFTRCDLENGEKYKVTKFLEKPVTKEKLLPLLNL